MRTSIITAMDDNRAIGYKNALPWYCPEDLEYFKNTTMGKPVIMGRKTFESLKKPLPGRLNIVMRRTGTVRNADTVALVSSLSRALELAKSTGSDEVFIIGGAEIYSLVLEENIIDRMYITHVVGKHKADTYFPYFDASKWKVTGNGGGFEYEFLVYDRK